jgi:hypothetical protein
VKVLAGAPVIEKAWSRATSRNGAQAGVKLLGEVGLGGVKGREEREAMVAGRANTASRARSTPAGRRVPGSGLIDKDVVLEADADVIGHINGGHTAPCPSSQIRGSARCAASDRDRPQRQRGAALIALRTRARAERTRAASSLGPTRRPRSGRAAARHPAHDRML